MKQRQRVPGRGLIATAVMSTALIQPLVDFSGSHVFNDDWPPHAHFHDLAAIGMMEICSATSMYLLWTKRGDHRLNTAVAAILPAAFWAPFFPAHFVSGSSLDDTTAHHKGPQMPKIGRFTLYPNATIAAIELIIIAAGWSKFRRSHP
jgi:hypothetical protein